MKDSARDLRFSDPLMSWIELLYTENSPPKRNNYANGKLSKEYEISLGVAQGCPLSPLLFLIIVMEGMDRLVTTNKDLTGVSIKDIF